MTERPAVFEIAARRARKTHSCVECQRLIQPGQTYEEASGCWPDAGGWQTMRTCQTCVDLRSYVCKKLTEDDWPPFGGLYDTAEDSGDLEELFNEAGLSLPAFQRAQDFADCLDALVFNRPEPQRRLKSSKRV